MGQQAEGIGVTFKVREVLPLDFVELFLQGKSFTFGEEGRDGPFARMAEGWIAQIVGQAGS